MIQNTKVFLLAGLAAIVIIFGTYFISQNKVFLGAPLTFISAPATTTRAVDFGFTIGTTTPLSLYGTSTLAIYGSTTIQTPINTLHAFRIINAASSTVFSVDTVNSLASTSALTISNLGNTGTECLQINNQGVVDNSGAGCGGSGSPGGSNTQFQFNDATVFGGSPNFVYTKTNSFLGLGTTTPGSLLSISATTTAFSNQNSILLSGINLIYASSSTTTILSANAAAFAFATSSANIPFFRLDTSNYRLGIGTTTPGATLAVGGAGNIYALGGLGVGIATTTAGTIETTAPISIGGAGTSTFANGIVLTRGCLLTPAGTCAGVGGGATATLTTEKPFDTCSPQVTSTTFAPGGAFFDYAGDFPAIHALNATSSRIICTMRLPRDIATTPAALVITTLTATTSGNTIWDIYATTTTPSFDGGTGGSAYGALTTGLTVLLNASSTAASRFVVHGTANFNADATTTSLSLTLTGGNDLIIIYERAGANANDTLENGAFFLDKASGLRFDINVN